MATLRKKITEEIVIESGPCDPEALALVLAYLKRVGISVERKNDFASHRDIHVTLNGERSKLQVHSKGGIVGRTSDRQELDRILRSFTKVVGTKPSMPTSADSKKQMAFKPTAELDNRLEAIEAVLVKIQEALENNTQRDVLPF